MPPTTKAGDTNLAPMFQGTATDCKWGDYHLYGGIYYNCLDPSHQVAFKDDTVTYNGHSSIRFTGARTRSEYYLGAWRVMQGTTIIATYSTQAEADGHTNWARELNNYWITVQPGDRVFFSAYIKTNPQSFGYGGAIGFDIYSSSQRLWEVHKRTPDQDGIWDLPHTGSFAPVPYGTDWTYYEIDITIPTTPFTQTDNGVTLSTPQYAAGIIIWLGASHDNDYDAASVWFADTVLYVNPSETPEEPTSPSGGTTTTDTIGGTGANYEQMGYLHTFAITASGNGTLSSIGVNLQSAVGNIRAGIYSTYSGGQFSGLLGESSSTIAVTGWNDLTIPGSVSIIAGTTYYISYQVSAWGLVVYGQSSGTHYYKAYSYSTFPDPSGAVSNEPWTANMRMNYTTPSTGTYVFATSSITGSGTLSYDPTNVTTLGVINGTWVDVYATPSTGYEFSYCNVTATVGGTQMSYSTVSSFSVSLTVNMTFTALFIETTTATPTPTPATIIYGTTYNTLYFRSDSYTTNNVTAYGLDTYNTEDETVISDTITTENVTYGFRVWRVPETGAIVELTSGTPVAQLTRTSNGIGWQNSTWTPAETTLTLGEDAIEVKTYLSTDNGGTWTARATHISNPLPYLAVEAQTWTFYAYTARDTTAGATNITFGDATYNSRIGGIGFTDPEIHDLLSHYFITGDYVLFVLTTYTSQIGAAVYLFVLLIPTLTLYLRHRNFGPTIILFALFGGPGGAIWFFVPAYAAIVVDIILVMAGSFLFWKLIR